MIGAATDWMALDQTEILERVMRDDLGLPAARGHGPIGHRAIKEKQATFRAGAGVDRIRPPVRAELGVENLLLAGDWCDTGGRTMEGAVRSNGYLAGAEAVEVAGVPDLPVSAGGLLGL